MKYPNSIQNLINQFAKLPSIGPKSAERLVFHMLYRPQNELHEFSRAIDNLKSQVKQCQICFNFAESDPCPICSDSKRDKTLICVTAKPQEMAIIEKTGYNGVYHILGGNINPLENISPQQIKIKELLTKIKQNEAKEVILALNPDISGETTSLYLTRLIKQFPNIKVSRLARGLPMGADLEYADEVTLENALKDRKEL